MPAAEAPSGTGCLTFVGTAMTVLRLGSVTLGRLPHWSARFAVDSAGQQTSGGTTRRKGST